MSKEKAATPTGVANEGEENKPLTAAELDALRSESGQGRLNALDAIAQTRTQAFEEESGVKLTDEPAKEPATKDASTEGDEPAKEPAKPAELDPTKQAAAQTDDVIDLDALKGKKVRIKVDGQEQLIDGEKYWRDQQKAAAADARLAAATEKERAAQTALDAANAKLAEANTTAERKAAEKQVAAAQADVDRVSKEFADALYGGDADKAVGLFKQAVTGAVDAALKERGTPAIPDVQSIVAQTTAAVRQQLSVDGARDKLFSDYPEIAADDDLKFLADKARHRYETEGHSRPEAIALAGEELGKKFSLGKFKAAPSEGTSKADSGTTTRDAKRAAKEGIDEVPSTGLRSTSSVPREETPSETIAEMARQRGAGRLGY